MPIEDMLCLNLLFINQNQSSIKLQTMAEIKIEKKQPIWPWILVILLILAAIYFFWYSSDQNFDNRDDLILRDTISQNDGAYRYNDDRNTNDFSNSMSLYSGKYGTVQNEQAFVDYFTYLDSREITSDKTKITFKRNYP